MSKCFGKICVVVFLVISAMALGMVVMYAALNTQLEHDIAKCVLKPSSSDVSVEGTLYIQQNVGGFLSVTGNITGLSEGKHGLHLHTYGVDGGTCDTIGDHYNPDKTLHGNPFSFLRHAGDFGNIDSGADGRATVNLKDAVVSLKGSRSILGRSLAVTAFKDDLGKGEGLESRKTGTSGPVLACCSILTSP